MVIVAKLSHNCGRSHLLSIKCKRDFDADGDSDDENEDGEQDKRDEGEGSLFQCCLYEEGGQAPRRPAFKRLLSFHFYPKYELSDPKNLIVICPKK